MEYQESKKRIQAAMVLLTEETTSREKFSSITALIQGLHPSLDNALKKCDEQLTVLEQIQKGEVIELTAGALPEDTEERKKRKKALLLFIGLWKDLQSEVTRVGKEFENQAQQSNVAATRSSWSKIFSFAKGPFGITTIAVVVIAATLQATAVRVVIENKGCETMYMSSFTSIPLPGLSLPNGAIASGENAVATIPPITFEADGAQAGAITLSGFKTSFTYTFPKSINDVEWNGTSLVGRTTELRLGEREEHSLVFICR